MKQEQLRHICQILRKNEETAQKFFEIESEILSVLDYKGLFERLVWRIKEKLAVPYVWITVIRDTALHDTLRVLSSSPVLMDRIGIIERQVFLALFPDKPAPVLINQDLKAFDALFPHGRNLPIGSMAVSPLTLDGELVGSLNQADPDPGRFHPDKGTGLLEQLAVKISLCLSNVTAHERLRMMATTDPLTSLLNRRTMEERLHAEFLRAGRYGSPLSVAFIDLDGFKAINDTQGHDAGDECLRFFAHELGQMSREIDIVCRFAGDEFVVVAPNTAKAEAEAFMRRMQAHFDAKPLVLADGETHVRFSHGVAESGDQGAVSPSALLKLADMALYENKRARKRAARSGGALEDQRLVAVAAGFHPASKNGRD
jgi:diguanylate cyclase (GGDEF)-like protein